MTTHRVPDPTVIHFTIDGRHGILGARHIVEALHIPYEPHIAIFSQIRQHLGILPPPEHDMPGPSEPTAPSEEATPAEQAIPYQEATPVEQTMPHEETTTVEVETQIRALRRPQQSHRLHMILPPLPDHLSTFYIYLLW
ncbi:hypothetical protein AAG906_022916 [Vitis piasezkii]